jgi:hypothetical protein
MISVEDRSPSCSRCTATSSMSGSSAGRARSLPPTRGTTSPTSARASATDRGDRRGMGQPAGASSAGPLRHRRDHQRRQRRDRAGDLRGPRPRPGRPGGRRDLQRRRHADRRRVADRRARGDRPPPGPDAKGQLIRWPSAAATPRPRPLPRPSRRRHDHAAPAGRRATARRCSGTTRSPRRGTASQRSWWATAGSASRPPGRETITRTPENVEGMSADALRAGIPWTFETFPE